ncbi:hypothetical protein CR513_41950, partial [Mucuna pruriens]
MATSCSLSKKEKYSVERNSQGSQPNIIGRVFALSGVEAFNYPLIALFDFEATHSFISHARVSLLKLLVSSLAYDLIINTLYKWFYLYIYYLFVVGDFLKVFLEDVNKLPVTA